MTETKKAETKVEETTETVELKFKKSTLIEIYSGNGVAVADGETVSVSPQLAAQMLYNLPENFELLSKGAVAEDVKAKARAHIENRMTRQKAAQKEIEDKQAKLAKQQNKGAFSK